MCGSHVGGGVLVLYVRTGVYDVLVVGVRDFCPFDVRFSANIYASIPFNQPPFSHPAAVLTVYHCPRVTASKTARRSGVYIRRTAYSRPEPITSKYHSVGMQYLRNTIIMFIRVGKMPSLGTDGIKRTSVL